MKKTDSIKLSDHFSYKKLLRYTFPSIIMMIFTSIYGVVDGVFVSNFAGTTAFSAVNFIMPYIMILGTVGFIYGTGGSALVAKTFGENSPKKANELFSLMVYFAFFLGVVITILGMIFVRPVAQALGAEGQMLEDCVLYALVVLIGQPAFVLQMLFQSFFVTAEKPQLGLITTVCAGVVNMVLDALLVGVIPLGIVGAATATVISQIVGAVIPIIYFARKNNSLLKLGKCRVDFKAIWKATANGSSEFMSSVSMSLVGMLYNVQLLSFAGENGVAAYGVLMYVSMIFNGIFIGYSVGTAPVISYHFGAQNQGELKSLLKKSAVIILISSVLMTGFAELLSSPLSMLFSAGNTGLFELTKRGFFIYSFAFLFMGFAIYFSSFFTALNDGLTSALISFLRTLVFQVAAVLILPMIMDTDGIWLSIVVAEFMAVVCSLIFLNIKKKKYGYM